MVQACLRWRCLRSRMIAFLTGAAIMSMLSSSYYHLLEPAFKRTILEILYSNSSSGIRPSASLSVNVLEIARRIKYGDTNFASAERYVPVARLKEEMEDKINSNKSQSFKDSHFMTLANVRGRLGNQLFQYATLLGTSLKYGFTPFILPSHPLLRYIDIRQIRNITLKNKNSFRERRCGTYDIGIEYLPSRRNWTLDGFFQSWKYFAHAREYILQNIKIKTQFSDNAGDFMRNVSFVYPGSPRVCVHIRRGDITTPTAAKRGYSVASMGYLSRAMNYFRGNLTNPVFILMSEDMEWCQTHVSGSDILYSPFFIAGEDMALMTLCEHVIVTSGSFGWWGAWIADGITVYYQDFPRPMSWLASQFQLEDYYPSKWIGMR